MATVRPLSRLRSMGFTVTRNGDRLHVIPRDSLTDAHRADIRDRKTEILAELDREQRSDEVTRMLKMQPGIKRAFIAEPLPKGAGLITLATLGVGTCELIIPEGRFDALAIMRLFDELEQPESSAPNVTAGERANNDVNTPR